MDGQLRQVKLFLILFLLVCLSLACKSITIALDEEPLTVESIGPVQRVGFDFSSQTPEIPEGDLAASRHLFLHAYPMPSDGFVTGVSYLNDSDRVSETFDLLLLRPDNNGWKIIYRIKPVR